MLIIFLIGIAMPIALLAIIKLQDNDMNRKDDK